jgi:serine/threonine protein kinase
VNDFKVIRVLGQGSFGKVMLVEDNMDGKPNIIKEGNMQ